MSDARPEQRWLDGKSALFRGRQRRRQADEDRRRRGRRIMRGAEVELEFESKNGVWHGGLVSADQGFDNRIIEFDCHIYPPGSASTTHRHNEAVIFVLKGSGRTFLDEEPVEWAAGDTLYIPSRVWHRHEISADAPAMVVAAKPIPLQEYLGELTIEYSGDDPLVTEYRAGSFAEEFRRCGESGR